MGLGCFFLVWFLKFFFLFGCWVFFVGFGSGFGLFCFGFVLFGVFFG